jgi:hypothetical protein
MYAGLCPTQAERPVLILVYLSMFRITRPAHWIVFCLLVARIMLYIDVDMPYGFKPSSLSLQSSVMHCIKV